MIGKTIMTAAFAIAAAGAVPATAQTSGSTSGSMSGQSGAMSGQSGSGTGSMDGSMTGNGTMSTGMPKMSKSQMAMMKRCQAMPSDKMMKNKSCTKMQKMHPEMMTSSSM